MKHNELKEMLRNIEAYCPNEACGDHIIVPDGTTLYKRRRLVLRIFDDIRMSTIYTCPVCNKERRFRRAEVPAGIPAGWEEF